ncbi:MAG: YfhO family protein [Clostridia bacterium]|nr:YfhO family protein [Clostridia bacterium]
MSFLQSEINPGENYKKTKRALLVLLSFAVPFIVMALGLVALRVVPFGSHNLAVSDGKYYINGLSFIKNIFLNKDGILYSFKNGLGGNEWSNFSWGGFNPVLLLLLFAKPETMPTWFTWISVVNMAVCGLTMYIFLARVKGPRLSHIVFSTSYAMMGFSVANCFQTGFFIGPQTLPLVALGLYLIFRGKSPVLYVISLGFTIFFNFYFGLMLCVFSVIIFLTHLYVNGALLKGRRLHLFLKWGGASVIAGLLAAPMWLPALKAFTGGGRMDQTTLTEYIFAEKSSFVSIFSKLFSGSVTHSEMINGLPNIFCGILTVALVVLFFMNRSVGAKKKRAAGVVLAFYLLTFFIPAFTILMHGGTHTNWFPYRYSFVFSFFLIALAAEEFGYIDSLTAKDLKKCGAVILVSTIVVFSTKYEFVTGGAVVLDLFLLLLMALGFRFYKKRPDKAPLRTFSMLLIILVSINLYANYALSISNMQKDEWELNLEEYDKNLLVNGALTDAVKMADGTFFRMEKDISESASVGADPYLYGYRGVSHSGPAERAFIHKGLSRLGINWYDMRHWYEGGIPAATDALLGLKYIIAERDLGEEKGYDDLIKIENTTLYKNENALQVAILSDGAAYGAEPGSDPFLNLNEVFKKMSGSDRDVFFPEEDVTFSLRNGATGRSYTAAELKEITSASESGEEKQGTAAAAYIEYSFTAKRDGSVYFFDTSIPDSPNGLSSPSGKYVGTYKKGDTATGKIDLPATYSTDDFLRGYCVNLSFAYADDDALSELTGLLNEREMTVDVSDSDTRLYGSFKAGEDQRIIFTVPWDEGWTCRIDGEVVPIDKTWDVFMSVAVPSGEHTYEMTFCPAWMNYGLIAAGAALLSSAVWGGAALAASKKRRKAK